MQDATGKPFAQSMQELVLAPAGMSASSFEQPLGPRLAAKAASGHFSDGTELPGRWHVFPGTPPPGCGRRRPTSPSSSSRPPMTGRAIARSSFAATLSTRC